MTDTDGNNSGLHDADANSAEADSAGTNGTDHNGADPNSADTNSADPRDIEMLVLDVDGVMTDASINIDDNGVELKRFNSRDGFGMRLWMRQGHTLAIITGRTGQALRHRLEQLGVPDEHIIQGSEDKSEDLDALVERTGVALGRIAFLGDDWPDLVAMSRVGYPMCVSDAEYEVKAIARFMTERSGGRGAVRDAIAHLLTRKGAYDPPVDLGEPTEEGLIRHARA